MTRVAFLGTPEAAVPTLELVAARHDVPIVITQPDRPAGRSRHLQAPPVKLAALRLGLPVAQPDSRAALVESLQANEPLDVGVVVAYGRILPAPALAAARTGMLNVHFSLLPRWRGAAPVNAALIAGDPMTGVTIIKLDEGLDTGPVVTAQAVDIDPDEDAGALTGRLAGLGARLLSESIDRWVSGELPAIDQSDDGVTYASKLTKTDRSLSTASSPASFVNRVRGLSPEPAATLEIDGERHKVFRAEPSQSGVPAGRWQDVDSWPVVGLDDGAARLIEIQAPGGKRMSGQAWLRGRHTVSGSIG